MNTKPTLLVTNDDGINSQYLHALIDAHVNDFNVFAVAPADEQSWSGRSFTRYDKLHVNKVSNLNCPAWSVSGTPTDCVNIALGHLLDKKPDIVISGINIGFNAGLPYILSSGTVAAALEATLWGITAVAYSQQIDDELFDQVRRAKGPVTPELKSSLLSAANHALAITTQRLAQAKDSEHIVYNVNFPSRTDANTPTEITTPGYCKTGSLFKQNNDGSYNFSFNCHSRKETNANTDYDCLLRNKISCSFLNFGLSK